MNRERNLVVISGPSGCGKDTVVRKIMELHPEVELSVSATSRKPRPGEKNGVDYFFLTNDEFEDKIQRGEVLEYTHYLDNYYGTLKSEIDRRIDHDITVILVIETEGAGNIRKQYPDSTTIFLLPPSMEVLEARLRGRKTESEEKILARLQKAKEEIKKADLYTRTFINDDLTVCANEIYNFILSRKG